MIDENGHIHCSNCGKEHALKLEGKLEWYCPRCKCYNKIEVRKDNTEALDKQKNISIQLKVR